MALEFSQGEPTVSKFDTIIGKTNYQIRVIKKMSPSQILENPPVGWEEVFEKSRKEIEFSEKKVGNYSAVVPNLNSIFEIHQRLAPSAIKVAIFTDEPDYETWDQMHGCGISGSEKSEPSAAMRQIHNRLFDTVDGLYPSTHNSLQKWIAQGVFISSVCLTCGREKKEKHKPLWNEFTLNVIQHIASLSPQVIFFFWGNDASEFKKFTPRNPTFVTGSLFSRVGDKNSFASMDHFNEANRILKAMKRKPINWSTV